MRPITRDSLPHLFTTALEGIQWRLSTYATRLLAFAWGIQLGRGCRFFGIPIFRRYPGSRIVIGEGCGLRSAPWSNLVGLNRPCMISTLADGAEIQIGRGSGLSGTVVGGAKSIRIGSGVMCGANVTITDTDWHPVDATARLAGKPGAAAAVVIEDRVWLSMNVTVLKGVTIGAGTVVAAGAVVTQSLPAGVLAGGQPAKVLRSL